DQERRESLALKTMNRVDPAALYYFKREFRALTDVRHPNLVKLYELFNVGEQWFFTMELVDGADLLSTLRDAKAPGRVAARTWLEKIRHCFRQLAAGLDSLHQSGKLHRDIKPPNVMVSSTGRVVLLDFGLSKEFDLATKDSSTEVRIVGTMAYMSPEQAVGRTLSPATDWYSVGVMLYEALTGQLPRIMNSEMYPVPLEDPRHLACREIASQADYATDDLYESLCRTCIDLLALKPADRFQGRDALRRMGSDITLADPLSAKPEADQFVGRRQELELLHRAHQLARAGRATFIELHGRSGIGKSTLIQRFLDEATQDRTVVLAGKCYEREYVPHKALDSLVDSLSHFLRRRKRSEAETFLPRDVASLVKLFPVLRRVDAVMAAPKAVNEIPDPQEVRRRAIASLRELLGRIADRMPLILWIDDLQWGDIDSVVVLAELFRSPQPPTLLLIASYRFEDSDKSPCILELRKALATAGAELTRQEIPVEALGAADAGMLAAMLLSQDATNTVMAPVEPHLAASIALESGGNPFFVGELVRHQREAHARGAGETTKVDLESVLIDRINGLAEPIRHLLEVISVAGRPLGAKEACAAIGLGEQAASIEQLTDARLVRRMPSLLQGEIDVWHDRIREAVVRGLSTEEWRKHHYQLAIVLEVSQRGDLEHLAMHFKEAGMPERASEYYASAADRAAHSLAFDRAAQFYRHAIEAVSADHSQRRIWQTLQGDALANAGRGADAAQIYLQAAEGSPPSQSLDLTRRAGFQYCITGHLDEGRAAFRNVLAKIGMSYPVSGWRTLLSLILVRVKLRLRGLEFRRRRPEEISELERIRMAITESVAMGSSTNNPWQGALFQSRHLLQALESGDPVAVALAVSWEAGYASMEGGSNWPRTSYLLHVTKTLAEETEDPHAAGSSALAFGIAEFLCGRYVNAVEYNRQAEQIFRDRCTGVTWEQDTAQVFGLWAWFYMGRIEELRSRYLTVSQEARERGDRYLMTTLGTQVGTFLHLVNDEPAIARETLDDLMSRWTNDGFTVQHHNALFARCMIDLYENHSELALRRLTELETRYRLSLLYNLQHIRIDLNFLKGRLFAEAAFRDRSHFAAWLRKAQRCIHALRRERMPYASALADYLAGNVVRSGNGPQQAMLQHAARELERVDLRQLSKAADWQVGLARNDASGTELIRQARGWFESQGVVNPARLARAVSLTFLGVESDILAAGDKRTEDDRKSSVDDRGEPI
ncbi:MAG: ATPase/protein kinase family protein, partial [Planctomycetaceae bacterium]|nr:ATPase/protein kinase family protein [Planctomycetaceae bacterium]